MGCIVPVSMILIGFFLVMWVTFAEAHDHNAPLGKWFNELKSGKGPCCSNNDGTVLSDVDWQSDKGRYSVRIDGKWYEVPDDAVVEAPNLAGPTMVWPIRGYGELMIRCFMPGVMM